MLERPELLLLAAAAATVCSLGGHIAAGAVVVPFAAGVLMSAAYRRWRGGAAATARPRRRRSHGSTVIRHPGSRVPHGALERHLLVTAVLCLVAVGLAVAWHPVPTIAHGLVDNSAPFADRMSLAFVVLLAFALVDLQVLRRLTPMLLIGSVVAVAPGVADGTGVDWLPTVVAQFALILHAAHALTATAVSRLRALLPVIAAAAVVCLLIALRSGTTDGITTAATWAAMVVAAGARGWGFVASVTAVVAPVVALAVTSATGRDALAGYLNPWEHLGSAGFETVRGQIAIAEGGIFGRGLGQWDPGHALLLDGDGAPGLVAVAVQLGVAGTWLLLCLYALLAYAGLRSAARARGAFAQLLGAGAASLVLTQAAISVLGGLGLMPPGDAPLPFISFDWRASVVPLAAAGLLLNVGRLRRPIVA